MTAKFMTPTVAKEINQHVAARGISVSRFEQIHGFSDRSICKIARGKRNCGGKLFAKLSKIISFSVQAHDEVEDVIANTRLGQRMSGYSRSEDRQPWPETVAKLKANPPMYARAW